MRTPLQQYVFVTKEATVEDAKWNLRDLLLFHAFNPAGLCAQRHAQDERVREVVRQRLSPSGAILAYGSGDRYNRDAVMEMATSAIDRIGRKGTNLRRHKVHAAIGCLRSNIQTVEAWLSSKV